MKEPLLIGRVPMLGRGEYLAAHLARIGVSTVLDLREYKAAPTKNDPDRLAPGVRWVGCDVSRLPALRALLQAAEAQALDLGVLTAEDYARAGLAAPPLLADAA